MDFLNNWVAEHLPIARKGDPIAARDLADQMMKAAQESGIKPDEINEEVWSVSEVIFEAMRQRHGGPTG
ncbi:hypothetical protein [Mesorhizobium huakuii]|nr:hypothetical protein [Mesorhizobium huakuii]